jgi:hypothetical protein
LKTFRLTRESRLLTAHPPTVLPRQRRIRKYQVDVPSL